MIYINLIVISFFVLGLPDMIRNFLDLRKKGARIYDPFIKIFECFKCTSFWVSLICSGGNFILACQISFIAYLIDKYIINKF